MAAPVKMHRDKIDPVIERIAFVHKLVQIIQPSVGSRQGTQSQARFHQFGPHGHRLIYRHGTIVVGVVGFVEAQNVSRISSRLYHTESLPTGIMSHGNVFGVHIIIHSVGIPVVIPGGLHRIETGSTGTPAPAFLRRPSPLENSDIGHVPIELNLQLGNFEVFAVGNKDPAKTGPVGCGSQRSHIAFFKFK